MSEFILITVLFLIIIYIVYLKFTKRLLWEDYECERIRRSWDFVYFYYQIHPKDIDTLTKEYFFEDHPLLKKVFINSTIEEIIEQIKNNRGKALLPYLNDVDKFVNEILYNNKPSFLWTVLKKLVKK
ncbi:MAG: hypothetical protein HY219_02850 [Candidatus Staskawiczbacteria bacterium]|nr:hypothetical protein [Candidatus Staskawiczbacteria bacterium]